MMIAASPDLGGGIRHRRRGGLHLPSLILFREPQPALIGCVIVDLAAGGAQLQGALPPLAPSQCLLLIGGNPHVRRSGRLVGRDGQRIAMRFDLPSAAGRWHGYAQLPEYQSPE